MHRKSTGYPQFHNMKAKQEPCQRKNQARTVPAGRMQISCQLIPDQLEGLLHGAFLANSRNHANRQQGKKRASQLYTGPI